MPTTDLPPTSELQALLRCAREAAGAAAHHALAHAARRRQAFRVFAHDVKLRLDRECQARAQAVILRRYPDHAILGEEGSSGASGAKAVWIVDPIDGTINFSHGLQWWCSSVAVRIAGRVVAGAVCAPAAGLEFSAHARSPALCNGRRIRTSSVRTLREALVLTGLDRHPGDRIASMKIFARLERAVQKTRVLGSAALDICNVARGAAEAYFESGIYVWDAAAAGLVLEQAGGLCLTVKAPGRHRIRCLASNPPLFPALARILLMQNGR